MAARRIAAAITAAVAATAMLVPAVCGATTDTGARGTGLLALRNGDIAAADPGRYDTVILNAWEAPRIPALRAANPNIRILVYKDMSSTRSYAVSGGVDELLLPTGVGYAYADLRHPEWFLTDTSGARVEWMGYRDHWWMDIGNTSYQNAWADNVSKELAAAGWDGVMIDNAMTSPQWYLPSGRVLAKYRDDASYQAATESFLANIGPRLRSAGKVVIPNLGGNVPSLDLYRRWLGHTSGMLREYWTRWGGDGTSAPFSGWTWEHQMEQLDAVEREGKQYVAITYGQPDDKATMIYARASFLLGWGGGKSVLIWTPSTAGTDPWAPEWTADVGDPTGPRQQQGEAWLRTFTRGAVVVNPSDTATVTVPLGGTYLDSNGNPVTSVSLKPTSAAILQATAAVAPIVAPTPALQPPAPTEPVTAPAAPVTAPQPGYRVLGSDGGIFSYGAAGFHGSVPGLGIRTATVALAAPRGGAGYWVLGADGGIFTFGQIPFLGSVPGLGLTGVQAIDLKATPSGKGYWVLGADGGVFSFGDARFFGSLPGLGIHNRAIALIPTRSGNGYWVLGADGGVFSFGDAQFFGSVPGLGIRTTTVSLAPTSSGNGYWLLGSDGGVFSFGDAQFFGSVPGLGVRVPGVKIASQPAGPGYYVLGENGEVFAFGAPALGHPAALGVRGRDLSVVS